MKLRSTTPASNTNALTRSIALLLVAIIFTASLTHAFSMKGANAVSCNTSSECEAQIQALEGKKSSYAQEAEALRGQADSLQTAVDKLSNEKSAIQAEVDISQAKYTKLNDEISTIETRIEDNKRTSGELIVRSSMSDDVPLIVRLAASNNLADYVESEASRTSVRDSIVKKTQENEKLKKELVVKKEAVENVLADQKQQHAQLASKEAEQKTLLERTRGDEEAYKSMIARSNDEISSLRKQQVAANSVFIPNYSAGTGPACGGGYPAKWCNIPQAVMADDWGMFNRECVSYTAFKVASSGRHMPYWGGIGNAYEWDDNARRSGIPVNGTPRPGSIGQTDAGPYGHVFHVDSVNSNGTINISQYNAAFDGRYSTATINPSGYNFIHF